MQLYSSVLELPRFAGVCVTIGNFDGVHLGHQSLIKFTLEIAKAQNLDSVLITFWPHPRMVLTGSAAHRPLTSRERRIVLLAECGAEHILELPFTPRLASLPAGDFVRDYLKPLNLRELVIGHDFTLGRGREGNASFLREYAKKYGFNVEQAPALMLEGSPVSSTRLRACLQDGDVSHASRLLGRPHMVCGQVVHGEGRGSGLGFPTANMETAGTLLPGNGIYATWAYCNGTRYQAATSIGTNPTFQGKKLSVESFLLDCDHNLYGRELCLEFIERLRPERAFDSPEELIRQIGRDVERTKKILKPQ